MNYKNFRNQTIDSIFTATQLENAFVLNAYMMESTIAWNNGDGSFRLESFPVQTQLSPVYAISIDDFDGDQIKDIVLGGNLDNVKPEVGRYDASYGTFLKGTENGAFQVLPPKQTGLKITGQVRGIAQVETPTGTKLIIARNNDQVQVFDMIRE